jgi:hypothetical protein
MIFNKSSYVGCIMVGSPNSFTPIYQWMEEITKLSV